MKLTIEILANEHGRAGCSLSPNDMDGSDVLNVTDEELSQAAADAKKVLSVLKRELLRRAIAQPIEPIPICSCGYKAGHPGMCQGLF